LLSSKGLANRILVAFFRGLGPVIEAYLSVKYLTHSKTDFHPCFVPSCIGKGSISGVYAKLIIENVRFLPSTVMTHLVGDKNTDNSKPHSICFFTTISMFFRA